MGWKMLKLFKFLLIVLGAIAVVPVSTKHHRRQPNHEVFESWGSTEIKVAKLKYTWTIKNFSFCCLDDNGGETLTSPEFSDGTNERCVWKLHLQNPRVQSYNYHNQNYISLYISLSGCRVKAEYKFGILNSKGKEINVVNNTIESSSSGSSNPEKLIKQDFLLDEENEILVDNNLIIFCEINATTGSESFSPSYSPSLPKIHYLNEDIGSLFEKEAFSDVTLSANGVEFKAHKAVLAARSAVFRKMFEDGITVVEIKDMYHQAVKEMLRYMYTDESSNLEYLAPDLLVAAEKYKLHGLKIICEDVMSANLTVENVAKYYLLGDKHSSFQLQVQAQHFIVSHFSDVIHTSAFKSLVKTHFHLVEHMFYAFSQKLATLN